MKKPGSGNCPAFFLSGRWFAINIDLDVCPMVEKVFI